ncbi:MAG TPA: beta-ketoacyl synthase chain length factor, partial [Verrucomicrobiae bacterium]|nr:beta-ketoacyl synthase chain length factor [Verrucomicrobiae bacterium]
PQPTVAAVTGLSVIGPGAMAERETEPPFPSEKISVHACGALADAALLSPNQRRRASRLVQMALLTARRSHAPDPAQHLAVAIGTGLGFLNDAAAFLENLIAKDEREPMPARFPNSVHNAAAAQVAIDQNARALNSAPTMGEISFESALWQGISQLATGEADGALVGAVDELNKYPLAIGKRWGLWNEKTIPGEGAMVASLTRAENSKTSLARVTAVRLGRYRQPFDAEREADWIAAAVDLKNVGIILSGAGSWPALDKNYSAVAAALCRRAGRKLEHQTYKQLCGEFHSASAFGFSVAVDLIRARKCGVLLYTLSLRGSKAVCCLQP